MRRLDPPLYARLIAYAIRMGAEHIDLLAAEACADIKAAAQSARRSIAQLTRRKNDARRV